MITKFNKLNARALGNDIAAALQEVGNRHGIKIEYAGGVVGDIEFICKMRCSVADKTAVETKEREDFANVCTFFGMTAADYGKEARAADGKLLRLVGFTNRSKYPVRVFDVAAGKEMLYTESVLRHFGRVTDVRLVS